MSLISCLLLQFQLLAIEVNWTGITDTIRDAFIGDTSSGLEGIIGENEMVVGLFILLIFLALTFMLGLGMLVGSVIIIPALFAVFNYIPSLQILVAIICGLLFGFGLHRIIRR